MAMLTLNQKDSQQQPPSPSVTDAYTRGHDIYHRQHDNSQGQHSRQHWESHIENCGGRHHKGGFML